MIYLLLSILSSTGIFVLFKSFNIKNIDTLQAIVVNYFTAFACGFIFYENKLSVTEILNSTWFYAALLLGFLFISIFNVMALTAQKNGLSVASVASKMSVVIPILFGIIIYNESVGLKKVTGILLALIAVYLTSVKEKAKVNLNKLIFLPIILFLGSGIIDTSVNHFAPENNMPFFLAIIFLIAGIIGASVLVYKSIAKKDKFNFKSIPYGIALGIVNYCSMFFLLKALRFEDNESSTIFTVNNVAIVAVSTLVGLIIFKEKIGPKNWIGISIALVSIILVTL
ncbi:MAG: DMT family transporter [Winogradskyella sp.]|uniref:EamA family transporter n=1 Tax=Winogradskyella sp. TaxID=1883156 RepID=UPI000F3F3DF7|nr:EamA family transporter [Winogradskyella sp.]RNC79772.1 MAG: DMT family transporter [Winogradskyella sp.]